MKHFKKTISFSFIAVIVCLNACKDDDETTVSLSNTDLLTEKNFVETNYLLTVDGVTEETFADLDDCDKDDFTRFEKTGVVTFDEGATKCDSLAPQTQTYSWKFLSDETQIELSFAVGFAEVFDILTNDGTTLKIRNTDIYDWTGDGQDNTVITTSTLTKQ